ncbi:MAG: hypothetical protein HGA45_34460, partial [Chloroflexales bacterium]|nr:hypothetical protein [Chloroflexales bacterium]
QGEALVFLASALGKAGELGRAKGIAERALQLPLAPARRVQLLAGRAWQSLAGGAWPEAATDLDEALSIAERAGDPRALPALAVALTGSLMGLPGGAARVARLSRLVATLAAPGDLVLHATTAAMRAWAAIWLDRWDEAGAEGRRAEELIAPVEAFTSIHAELYLQRPVRAALRGETALADEGFARLLTALDQQEALRRDWQVMFLHPLARVRWLQGRHDELRALYRRMAAALSGSIRPSDASLCREIGALVHLADGRAEEALGELRAIAADQARLAVAPIFGDPRLHLAYAYLRAARPDEALAAAGPALAAIRREGAPGRLRWQGPAVVTPILRLCAAGGPHADFAAAALAALEPSAVPPQAPTMARP